MISSFDMKPVLKYLDKANPLRILDAVIDIKGLLQDRDYRKMEKLGGKLGVPIPGMHCRRQIFMDGKEVFDSGLNRSHTVNRNYYNMVFAFANFKSLNDVTFGTGLLSLKATDTNIMPNTNNRLILAGSQINDIDVTDLQDGILSTADSILNGIVIGTNSGAESFEGVALGAIISSGSAGGEMDYTASELHSITNSTLTLKDTLIRDFNNNSAGAITVEEAGIYIGVNPSGGGVEQIMVTRDLTGGDVVAVAAQYRYTYESTLVFPS